VQNLMTSMVMLLSFLTPLLQCGNHFSLLEPSGLTFSHSQQQPLSHVCTLSATVQIVSDMHGTARHEHQWHTFVYYLFVVLIYQALHHRQWATRVISDLYDSRIKMAGCMIDMSAAVVVQRSAHVDRGQLQPPLNQSKHNLSAAAGHPAARCLMTHYTELMRKTESPTESCPSATVY